MSDIIGSTTDNLTLLAAAFTREPWLLAALNEVTDPTDIDVSHETLGWLEDVADYRKDNNTEHRDPFGGYQPGTGQTKAQQLVQAMDLLGVEPDWSVEQERGHELDRDSSGKGPELDLF